MSYPAVTPNQHPWRLVISSRTYTTPNHPRGRFSRAFVLACGHELHRKASRGVLKRMRCDLCPVEILR